MAAEHLLQLAMDLDHALGLVVGVDDRRLNGALLLGVIDTKGRGASGEKVGEGHRRRGSFDEIVGGRTCSTSSIIASTKGCSIFLSELFLTCGQAEGQVRASGGEGKQGEREGGRDAGREGGRA